VRFCFCLFSFVVYLLSVLFANGREYEALYVQAQRVRRLVCRDFEAVFASGVHLLATPTAPSLPAPLLTDLHRLDPLEGYATDVMTVPASLAGTRASPHPLSFVRSHACRQVSRPQRFR
jgi:aspartyl-tRNA(Asn)/glutamyl-tRNA(Gln) amidotransferase subunit A